MAIDETLSMSGTFAGGLQFSHTVKQTFLEFVRVSVRAPPTKYGVLNYATHVVSSDEFPVETRWGDDVQLSEDNFLDEVDTDICSSDIMGLPQPKSQVLPTQTNATIPSSSDYMSNRYWPLSKHSDTSGTVGQEKNSLSEGPLMISAKVSPSDSYSPDDIFLRQDEMPKGADHEKPLLLRQHGYPRGREISLGGRSSANRVQAAANAITVEPSSEDSGRSERVVAARVRCAQALSTLGLSNLDAADASLGGLCLQELEAKKRRVKNELKSFDTWHEDTYGSKPTRQDKEPMRPLYTYYRKIKLRIGKVGGTTGEGSPAVGGDKKVD